MRSSLFLTTLALTGPIALAQTTATHHTTTTGGATHHTSTAHTAKPAGPPCATLPIISDKVPALPASVGCPKVLFTVSDRLDYINPIAERFRSTLFSELPVVISLDYAEIALGTGELARPQQYYTVKYTGYLVDGTKFDSSNDHDETKAGFTFPYGAHRVIAGWDLGFEGMRMGGKRRLYVPYQFGYGVAGQPAGKIPPKAMLIFDMELLSQTDQAPKPPTPPAAPSTPGQPSSPGSGSAAPGNTPQTSPDAKPAPPASTQPATLPPTQPSDTKPKPPPQ